MSVESANAATQHDRKSGVHFSTSVILHIWNYTVYVIINCTQTAKSSWNTHFYIKTTVVSCIFH